MEHPFYGSWGYQTTGYFAPTSRYGTPQDFMYLDRRAAPARHRRDPRLGAVAFPRRSARARALRRHASLRARRSAQGLPSRVEEPDLQLRPPRGARLPHLERALLARRSTTSTGCAWMRSPRCSTSTTRARTASGFPNVHGGKENLDAVEFLRQLNEAVYREHPDVQTIAEESTAGRWCRGRRIAGGLGFGMKWNMGWMHDTLDYFAARPDPPQLPPRPAHLLDLVRVHARTSCCRSRTTKSCYGKGSLIGKMPGDDWQQFANLRALYGYMWAHPGKKLLFMGGEFGQWREWTHDGELDWCAARRRRSTRACSAGCGPEPRLPRRAGAARARFRRRRASSGSTRDDAERERPRVPAPRARRRRRVLVVCNFTPVPRANYLIGVPQAGLLARGPEQRRAVYGGSGMGNLGGVACRARAGARPLPFAHADAAAARDDVPRA